jgi:hypothetical protein
MAQITKKTRNSRILSKILLDSITSTKALEKTFTEDLLEAASKLVSKAGDKEQGLLTSILNEIKIREDIGEIDPAKLLELSVVVINKAGEDDGEITKDIILKASKTGAKVKRV